VWERNKHKGKVLEIANFTFAALLRIKLRPIKRTEKYITIAPDLKIFLSHITANS
jgi:hypothetical protein